MFPVKQLRPHRSFLLVLGVFTLLSAPLLLTDFSSNYVWDEQQYYLPAIRRIEAQWPRLDLQKDSLSATAPGYAYFLATIAQGTGSSVLTLRGLNFLVSALVLVCLVWLWPSGLQTVRTNTAVLALAPLATSNFFVKSASFVVTDNAAVLCVTISLASLVWLPAWGPQRAGLFAAAATFVRQSAAWLMAPIFLRAVVERDGRRRLLGMAAMLLPTAVLGTLLWAWGGPTPPAWREAHWGGGPLRAPATAAYLLAVVALLSPAYALAAGKLTGLLAWRDGWALAAAGAGLVAALAGPNTYSAEAGRWGGYLWNATNHLPAWHDRSLLFIGLAPLGGWMMAKLVRTLFMDTDRERSFAWAAGFAAWFAASLLNQQSFHRYFEPTLLVFLVFWLGLVRIGPQAPAAAVNPKPLLTLTLAQFALTLATAHARVFGLI